MTVIVKLFAIYAEVYGQSELVCPVETGTTIADILNQLEQAYPQLAPWRAQSRYALNYGFVNVDSPLADGDELAIIPPVSGG